ncbi:MAG TPA: hypothetical protein EYG73_07670, partial [Arcobacter sp.]|nr:hypothetical protein [Arcobacter sp.]
MLKYLILFEISLFIGCGGGSENQNTSEPIDSFIDNNIFNEVKTNEPYYYQQWYLEENRTFYHENNIDANASIHFGKSYKYTGKGIRIAIIDDGLDITHYELNGSIVETYDINSKTAN